MPENHQNHYHSIREQVWTLGLTLLTLTIFAACIAYAMNPLQLFNGTAPTMAAANGKNLPTIVVDAGHGGMDGGASGKSGVPERDINLAVSQRTEQLLTLLGFSVRMTRETEDDIAPAGDYPTIRSRKVADMHRRAELVEEIPNAVLLSIHMNSYQNSRYHGAQVFYGKADGAKELAESLQANLAAVAQPENTRVAAAVNENLYLYRTVSCPALLIECGFLTNPTEEKQLLDESYQKTLAVAISAAMTEKCWRMQ